MLKIFPMNGAQRTFEDELSARTEAVLLNSGIGAML
jgi:hypothetical protein